MRNDAARDAFRGPEIKTSEAMRDLVHVVTSVPSYGRVHVGARCGVGARIAPPFMEATDASRLVCVVVVSYQEYSLTLCSWCIHSHHRSTID